MLDMKVVTASGPAYDHTKCLSVGDSINFIFDEQCQVECTVEKVAPDLLYLRTFTHVDCMCGCHWRRIQLGDLLKFRLEGSDHGWMYFMEE